MNAKKVSNVKEEGEVATKTKITQVDEGERSLTNGFRFLDVARTKTETGNRGSPEIEAETATASSSKGAFFTTKQEELFSMLEETYGGLHLTKYLIGGDLDVDSDASDDEINQVDETGIMTLTPRRTPILDKFQDVCPTISLSSPFPISLEKAREALSDERHRLLAKENPKRVFLSDSAKLRRLYVVLETETLATESILPPETRNRFREVAGDVRDQDDHRLCWEYAFGDLVSSTRVLKGLDKEFEPMAPMYLCQLADPTMFENQPRVEVNGKLHNCFGYRGSDTGNLVKLHGVVKVVKGDQEEVVCTQKTDFSDRKKYFIKDFSMLNTLNEAWTRLKTTPILAGLICFTGWDGNDIYRGPLTKDAQYEGEHLVVLFDITKINGESVAICKSSNGKNVGLNKDGFIVVSLEVMIMLAGRSIKKDDVTSRWCSIRPQYLLSRFITIELDPQDKQEGQKETDAQDKQEMETEPQDKQEELGTDLKTIKKTLQSSDCLASSSREG